MSTRIVALVAVALLLVSGVTATSASFQSSGERTTVEAESFDPQAGNVTVLADSNFPNAIYSDSVIVRNNKGARMAPGEDYVWYASNGTIETLAGGRLEGKQNAQVTYSYSEPSENSRGIATLLGYGFNAASFMVIVLGLGVVFAALTVLRRLD